MTKLVGFLGATREQLIVMYVALFSEMIPLRASATIGDPTDGIVKDGVATEGVPTAVVVAVFCSCTGMSSPKSASKSSAIFQ